MESGKCIFIKGRRLVIRRCGEGMRINLGDGGSVHYYEWGSSDKPKLVCLHGLANNGVAFLELAEYLEDEYHIFCFDSPGHGQTPPFEAEEDFQFTNLAKWYDDVFRHMFNQPFYILGHSWGSDVALHYAKQFPDKINGVILLDGGFTFPDFQEDITFSNIYEAWNDYMDQCSIFDTWEEVVREYKNHTERWNENVEKMVLALFDSNDRYELITSKFTVLSIIKAFFQESFRTTYPYIKSPMLLIHATLPADLADARKKGIAQLKHDINDVTIVSLVETNHMVHWEKPQEVANEIRKWDTGGEK